MNNLDKQILLLERLTNKKIVLVEQENIFVPRHETDNRQEKYLQKINKILQQEVFVGDLDLSNLPITSLGNLKEVTGRLNLENTKITSLGNLREVNYLDLQNTPITSLGNLKEVNYLFLQNTPISKDPKLLKYYKNKFKDATIII